MRIIPDFPNIPCPCDGCTSYRNNVCAEFYRCPRRLQWLKDTTVEPIDLTDAELDEIAWKWWYQTDIDGKFSEYLKSLIELKRGK